MDHGGIAAAEASRRARAPVMATVMLGLSGVVPSHRSPISGWSARLSGYDDQTLAGVGLLVLPGGFGMWRLASRRPWLAAGAVVSLVGIGLAVVWARARLRDRSARRAARIRVSQMSAEPASDLSQIAAGTAPSNYGVSGTSMRRGELSQSATVDPSALNHSKSRLLSPERAPEPLAMPSTPGDEHLAIVDDGLATGSRLNEVVVYSTSESPPAWGSAPAGRAWLLPRQCDQALREPHSRQQRDNGPPVHATPERPSNRNDLGVKWALGAVVPARDELEGLVGEYPVEVRVLFGAWMKAPLAGPSLVRWRAELSTRPTRPPT